MARLINLELTRALQLDDWVLCRIFQKNTGAQRIGKEHNSSCVEEVSLATCYDLLTPL
jgi:hypothetical protein